MLNISDTHVRGVQCFFYVDICQCQEARSAPKGEALINEMLPVVRYFCGAEIHFTKHHNEDDRG